MGIYKFDIQSEINFIKKDIQKYKFCLVFADLNGKHLNKKNSIENNLEEISFRKVVENCLDYNFNMNKAILLIKSEVLLNIFKNN